MLKQIPKDYFDSQNNTLKLLWEEEWRGLGITQVQFQHHNPPLAVETKGDIAKSSGALLRRSRERI